MKYRRILQDFNTPDCRIDKGEIRSQVEWEKDFSPRALKNLDWFEEVPDPNVPKFVDRNGEPLHVGDWVYDVDLVDGTIQLETVRAKEDSGGYSYFKKLTTERIFELTGLENPLAAEVEQLTNELEQLTVRATLRIMELEGNIEKLSTTDEIVAFFWAKAAESKANFVCGGRHYICFDKDKEELGVFYSWTSYYLGFANFYSKQSAQAALDEAIAKWGKDAVIKAVKGEVE
jgi:hypothetical protein